MRRILVDRRSQEIKEGSEVRDNLKGRYWTVDRIIFRGDTARMRVVRPCVHRETFADECDSKYGCEGVYILWVAPGKVGCRVQILPSQKEPVRSLALKPVNWQLCKSKTGDGNPEHCTIECLGISCPYFKRRQGD